MSFSRLTSDKDMSIAVRAAWMHYAGGMTQSEVAKRLGLSSLKAHRLITKANQEGLIKVFIEGDVSECMNLETVLMQNYGLEFCQVVPDLDEDDLPLRALGIAGASFLRQHIEGNTYSLIGVGHGRTLASVVDYLPKTPAGDTKFISVMGGLTRNFSASPHDVIHRLARRTLAEAFVMPVPFIANSAEDREVLLNQNGIRDVFNMAMSADLHIVGVGTTEPMASLVEIGMISPHEISEVKEMGGVGEILGHFFDAEGRPVETPLSSRTIGISRDALADTKIVAIAGGKSKACAIRSILNSRSLSGLITDERTAYALVHNQSPQQLG